MYWEKETDKKTKSAKLKWKVKNEIKKGRIPSQNGGQQMKERKKRTKKKGLAIKPKISPNIKGIGEAEGGVGKKSSKRHSNFYHK